MNTFDYVIATPVPPVSLGSAHEIFTNPVGRTSVVGGFGT